MPPHAPVHTTITTAEPVGWTWASLVRQNASPYTYSYSNHGSCTSLINDILKATWGLFEMCLVILNCSRMTIATAQSTTHFPNYPTILMGGFLAIV
ncbi:hypothetical protein AVEN_151373-1 [Araneus ventricosus]|uniref:Uncharacterized protein n=1 Tax=Araneus ventricosus TaxID=182803 RepID=A0A4Y2C976_ARAVE|nr:hypothetical protein AVEN_151373-1 [Araneus ventricosus]